MAMADIPEQADTGGIQVWNLNDVFYMKYCHTLQ